MTQVALDELVTAADIARMLEVSRERVVQLARRDDFPEHAGVVGKSKVWRRPAVEAWARSWNRAPGRPRKSEGTS